MKKISTLCIGFILMFALFNSSTAQDSTKTRYVLAKGTKLISGSVQLNAGGSNYQSANPSQFKNFSLFVGERNGYFVTNNLVLGSTMAYAYSSSKEIGPIPSINNEYQTHFFLPGLFLRYYKMFTPKFGIFGQFNGSGLIGIFRNKTGNQSVFTEQKQWGLNFYVSPHLAYFVSKRIALEAGFGNMGFSYIKEEFSESFVGGLSFNPSLDIGISLYLGKGPISIPKN